MSTWLIVFLINWALNILIIEFQVIRKLKTVINVDEARDSLYPAFRRNDVGWFNRPWLYLTCPFMLLRLFIAFLLPLLATIVINIAVIGLKPDDKRCGWRYAMIRSVQVPGSYICMACTGCYWYKYNRPEACYKKYLGPDWVADYDWLRECGCVVSNHSSLLEFFVHAVQQISTFVAKVEVSQDFSMGQFMKVTQCLIVTRESKDSKKSI